MPNRLCTRAILFGTIPFYPYLYMPTFLGKPQSQKMDINGQNMNIWEYMEDIQALCEVVTVTSSESESSKEVQHTTPENEPSTLTEQVNTQQVPQQLLPGLSPVPPAIPHISPPTTIHRIVTGTPVTPQPTSTQAAFHIVTDAPQVKHIYASHPDSPQQNVVHTPNAPVRRIQTPSITQQKTLIPTQTSQEGTAEHCIPPPKRRLAAGSLLPPQLIQSTTVSPSTPLLLGCTNCAVKYRSCPQCGLSWNRGSCASKSRPTCILCGFILKFCSNCAYPFGQFA